MHKCANWMAQDYKAWKFISRVSSEDGRVTKYAIQFYRPRGDGDWYDEIRYDSHETRKSRLEVSPHFHLKLMSNFKLDTDAAVEEIKKVIDNYVSSISVVIEA
jgi:hypothetical protein